MVKAVEKRVHKREEEEKSVSEAWVQPEKTVQVREAARLAATAERDRMVEAAKVCMDGPAMVAAAHQVVEAARVVTAL